MRFLIAFTVTVALAFPALARPLTSSEATALGKSVVRYLSAIGNANAPQIVEALPPRILNVFAGSMGAEAGKLEEMLVDQTKTMLKGTKFRDLSYGQDNLAAEDSGLADGTVVTWVLVPTRFTAVAKGAQTRHEQPLLALNEGGDWYFLRIEGPQSQQLASIAYPFLADVTFPPASATPMQ